MTRVKFVFCDESIQQGDRIAIVGGLPALGNWDPAQALVMETHDGIFPSWISDTILVHTHTDIEYKYIILPKDPQQWADFRWEDFVGNRKFYATGFDMTIEDDEGRYREFSQDSDDDDSEDNESEKDVDLRTPAEVRTQLFEERFARVQELEGGGKMDPNDVVFMVSMRLPVQVVRGEDGGWRLDDTAPSDGRNFAFLPLLHELRRKSQRKVVCMGWPGVHVEHPEDQDAITNLLEKRDCIPIFPPESDFNEYIQFCTSFLWPAFHDVMLSWQTSNPQPFDEQGWAAYQHLNNFFAKSVVRHAHENDLIWIHDYHLLMTPTFISRRSPLANIGLFLHTPFPSSDCFKSLPIREELLSGMLGADLLGFQFFAYARNFLVAAKRIFGHEPRFDAGGFMSLNFNGRQVQLKVAHFVYPFTDTQRLVSSDIVSRKAEEVKAMFKGKAIFASMDRCDNLSGLVPKFRAFKQFTAKGTAAVLIQYTFDWWSGHDSTSSLVSALHDYADGFLEVDENGKMTIVPKEGGCKAEDCEILLRAGEMDRLERLALFRSANVLLDTCVKAGLNLMPFEFVTAHHDDENDHGVCLVSEFSGCSRILSGVIRINPWNTAALVEACGRALEMDSREKKERSEQNLAYVSNSSPIEWFDDFLVDLRRARKKSGTRIENIGLGSRLRHVHFDKNFVKLSREAVLGAYRSAKNRVFFLDNEGTLAADTRHVHRTYGAPKGDVTDLQSSGSAPRKEVLECLNLLCQDPLNTVVVLSGRKRDTMDQWFGSIPKIGLAAERGFHYRLPMTGFQWHCMKQDPDYTWQSYAFEIMRQFVKRTQGSYIETKGSALVWQYRDADQHFGSWQAKELSSHLKELLFGFDEVQVEEGKGWVEVKLRGINKGVAVSKILSKVSQTRGDVDFVLCIGDDRSDEDMFRAIKAFSPDEDLEKTSLPSTTDPDGDSEDISDKERHKDKDIAVKEAGLLYRTRLAGGRTISTPLCALGSANANDCKPPHKFFTCTVGQKPSDAAYYLDDVEEVTELLDSLRPPTYRNSHTWGQGSRGASMPTLASLRHFGRQKS